MAVKVYVDLDATGNDDGTTIADAYNTSSALADAFGDALFTLPAAEDHEIYIADVDAGEYTITAEHEIDNSGSRILAANDFRFKVIGCDTSMTPITTEGTYVKIRATSALTYMFEIKSASEMSNVNWYNINFDADANADYCVGSLNASTIPG